MGLRELVSNERPRVPAGLLSAYNGIDNLLIVSLWNSDERGDPEASNDAEEDDYVRGGKEIAFQVQNCDLEEKGPAYAWLDQGAEQLCDRY